MTPYEIISKKRDGMALNRQELTYFIRNYSVGKIPDYQMSALLMAIYLRGFSAEETKILMEVYLQSGKIIRLDDIPGVKVDKHSTGGVGDKVSIVLAPIVAAAGVKVPMISGRGLGHTGGTLDKLESIPGFKTDYTIREFRKKIATIGTCLIGQTPELVPAEMKIYALRDVTATIQAIPLIAASIMSKKIAEGIDALVLDIKTGSGAFMLEEDQALNLAKILIQIGEGYGKQTVAYITNMDSPLGNAVGNWVEIVECIKCLQNAGPNDLMQVIYQLAGTMLYLGKKANSIEAGMEQSNKIVRSGKAWEKFLQIIKSQNGDIEFIKNPSLYPHAKYHVDIIADQEGWIKKINTLEIGLVSQQIGAGRQKSDDIIHPKAGILFHKKVADAVKKNEPVATLYTDNKNILDIAALRISNAFLLSSHPLQPQEMILQYVDKSHL